MAVHNGRSKTRFSERKIFRSSIHIKLGDNRSRNIDEGAKTVDFHVDLNNGQLANSALRTVGKESVPEFLTKPKRQFVHEKDAARFKVVFDGSPATELTWSFHGKLVNKDDRHKIYKEGDAHILEILHTTPEDNGVYTCTIENSAGATTASAALEVLVRPKSQTGKASRFTPPSIDVPLEDTEFMDKEKDATLLCKFHNAFDGTPVWLKDGREVGSWQAKSTFDGSTARLVFREASRRVCGTYECAVKNIRGEARTKARVSLLDPSVKPTAPKFTTTLTDQTLEIGEILVLETEVTGQPRPCLTWYKNKKELGPSQDIRMEFHEDRGRLIVDNIDTSETTTFTCVATNCAGQDKTSATVNVSGSPDAREPPIFTKELSDMEVNDGERVEMSVEVKGSEPIDIVWVHNNRQIPPTDPVCRMVTKGNQHMLIIPEVFPEDSGEYVCEAYNDYGDTDTFCRLNVHEEKSIENEEIAQKAPEFVARPKNLHVPDGASAKFSCMVAGEPPPSVQWIKGRQPLKHRAKYKISSIGDEHFLEITSATTSDIAQYTCTLCNPLGTTSATCELTVGDKTLHNSSTERSELRLQRNRSQDRSVKRGRDSESSDVSSVELEILRPTFAIKRSSAPVLENVPVPPFHGGKANSVNEIRNGNSRNQVTVTPIHSETVTIQANGGLLGSSPSKNIGDQNGSNSASTQNVNTPHDDNISPKRLSVTKLERQILPCNNTNNNNQNNLASVSSSSQESSISLRSNTSLQSKLQDISTIRRNSSPVKVSVPGKNVPLNKPKTPEENLIVDKKGGVAQIDFRAVLKKNANKQSNDSDSNGHARKLATDINLPKRDKLLEKVNLSQKRSVFEADSLPPRPRKTSLNIPREKEEKKAEVDTKRKVNAALKQFEENTSTAKTDFRDVLKHKTEDTAVVVVKSEQKDYREVLKHKPEETAPAATKKEQKDFREVLKHKTDEDGSLGVRKDKPKLDNVQQRDFRNVLKHRSESEQKEPVDVPRKISAPTLPTQAKLKIPSAFETIEQKSPKSDRITEGRLSLDIGKANSRRKAVEIPTVAKSDTKLKQLTNKLEFKSVLKPNDSEKLASQDKFNGEVVRPVPRRLSQGKVTMEPNLNPRRLSQSKVPNVEICPTFQDSLENRTVDYGSEVVLECHVNGSPYPDICWSVNDKEIKQSKFFRMSYSEDTARLVIAEAFSEDEGEYTCTATNVAGSSQTTCNVKVHERCSTPETESVDDPEPFSPTATPPKIYNISPSEFCIKRGGTIELKASYTSVPAGTVTWSKKKQLIKSEGRMRIETDEHFSTLTISDIESADSGRFDVTVKNKLGQDTAFASLSVEDVPEPPVGQPWVNEVTLTSATVSWYGPAYDGGCPVTNYRLEMCDAEEQDWTLVTANCVSTTFKVQKLRPHTPYFFKVYAENKHGLSEPCQTPEVTVTSDRRPSALLRLPSTESDEVKTPGSAHFSSDLSDVFTHETNEPFTPLSEYGLVSPLSPDEVSFDHREVAVAQGRTFDQLYKCMEEVGKGKFGSVYRCEEKATGKIWAAKILKCREADKKKIRLEVEIMNQLKHPKILQLWDAFDAPRKMILIMEYIGGGELFERVLDDGFELTERDCIQFMRQICDAVNYMHSRNILHLDLKPENILCIKNESNKIKIIDFGLARFYEKGESCRVLFGTPEFIAPEVVNYDEIGFTTDMWSIGVICYVLLTGLSPFMGDNDAETLANVTQGEYDFEEEEFESVTLDGKNFIEQLLVKGKSKRMTSQQALGHPWLAEDAARLKTRKINTKNLRSFMARRKWQKTGNAIRALGRITSLTKLLSKGQGSSASGQGSSSSSSLSSMGSQSTLVDPKNSTDVIDAKNSTAGSESKNSNTASSSITTNSIGEGTSEASVDSSSKPDINTLKENTVELEKVMTHNGGHSKSTNQEEDESSVRTNQNGGNLNLTNQDFVKTKVKDNQDRDINSNSSKFTFNSAFVDEKSNAQNGESNVISKSHDSKDECGTTGKSDQSSSILQSSSKSCHPEFTKEMVDSKAFPGDAVRFDVGFVADANTCVTWLFEDELITDEDDRLCIHTEVASSSLIIKDVCEDDDGEYTCKISNATGSETCSAELIVYGAL